MKIEANKAEAVITQDTRRTFIIKEDAYGIVVTDRISGVFVILDWNGERITGAIGRNDGELLLSKSFSPNGRESW